MKKIITILLVLFSGAYASDGPGPKRPLTITLPNTPRARAAFTKADQTSLIQKMQKATAEGKLLDPRTLTPGELAAQQAMLAQVGPKAGRSMAKKRGAQLRLSVPKITTPEETLPPQQDLRWNPSDFPEDHEEKAADVYLAIQALAEAAEANAQALQEAAQLVLETLNKDGD